MTPARPVGASRPLLGSVGELRPGQWFIVARRVERHGLLGWAWTLGAAERHALQAERDVRGTVTMAHEHTENGEVFLLARRLREPRDPLQARPRMPFPGPKTSARRLAEIFPGDAVVLAERTAQPSKNRSFAIGNGMARELEGVG